MYASVCSASVEYWFHFSGSVLCSEWEGLCRGWNLIYILNPHDGDEITVES